MLGDSKVRFDDSDNMKLSRQIVSGSMSGASSSRRFGCSRRTVRLAAAHFCVIESDEQRNGAARLT